MKVRRILSLHNGQVGPTQSETQLLANGNVIASMKVIRYAGLLIFCDVAISHN